MTTWPGRLRQSQEGPSGPLGSSSLVGVKLMDGVALSKIIERMKATSDRVHLHVAGAGGNFQREDSPVLLKAYIACNVVVAVTVRQQAGCAVSH